MGVAALLFSLMALWVKQAGRLPGPQVAFLRFAVGFLSIFIPLLQGRRLRPHSYWGLLSRGVFGGAAVLAYFLAISHLPVGVATLLNYSSPLFTVIFSSLFLGERMGLQTGLALLCTSAGVVLTVQGGVPWGRLGPGAVSWVLTGVGSAVLSGAAVTTIRAIRQHEGSWEIFLAFCLIGGLLTSVPAALSWVPPTRSEWALVLGVGASSVVAQICMTHALRDVRAATAGLMLQLTPAATFLLGMAVLGERPTATGLLGAVVTLLGISWGVVSRQQD